MVYICSNQKNLFGLSLEGLGMEKVGIFLGISVYLPIWYVVWYITAVRYISWPFDIFCGHLVYFVAIR
jgi:hypothetical protein